MPKCSSVTTSGMWKQVHQSTDFPDYVGFWSTKEYLLQNPTILFPMNRDEAKYLSLYHKMMPFLVEITKMDGHISPEMHRKIHEVMSGIHEKVRQSVVEQILAKSGTSTVQADRVSNSKKLFLYFFHKFTPEYLQAI